MKSNKYSFSRFLMQFHDREIEGLYRDYIISRTLIFCRISWGIVILLGSAFAFLDQPVFGNKSHIVLIVRSILLFISLIILLAAFKRKLWKFIEWHSFLFIMLIGFFCIFLISMSDNTTFSPYFTGLFFAFTGIFITVGLGYRFSFFALLIIFIAFEILFSMIIPAPPVIFLVYSFFLSGMILIFIFIGFLIEKMSRDTFVVSAKLVDSINDVKTLSGMLPICSSCKKIRNDEGYWQQVETYIENHSGAEFTHGLCPECTLELYGKEKWFKKK